MSPLTTEIVGRDVNTCARSVAVMSSTLGDVPATGDVNTNHIVTLHKRDVTVPIPQPPPTATFRAGIKKKYLSISVFFLAKFLSDTPRS